MRVSGLVEHHIEDSLQADYIVPAPTNGIAVAGRIEADMKAIIAEIIQGRKTGFRKESDLVRAAVHWFVNEKLRRVLSGHIDNVLQTINARTEKAQIKVRAYDILTFKNTNADAMVKMWGVGAKDEAVGWADVMMKEARTINVHFAREVKQWFRTDPRLTEIAAAYTVMKSAPEVDDSENDSGEARPKVKGKKGRK